MKQAERNTIYTIGHSTHSITAFIEMLQSFHIKTLVDIRHFPGSNKHPQFNKENLETALTKDGIQYIHLVDLRGRRKPRANSKNNRWHNESFKGYADYMETPAFEAAVIKLETIALQQLTAYMCAEAVWWRCHRSMVSDYLKARGWHVLHIMSVSKTEEHPYTSPARVVGNRVYYYDKDSFNQ